MADAVKHSNLPAVRRKPLTDAQKAEKLKAATKEFNDLVAKFKAAGMANPEKEARKTLKSRTLKRLAARRVPGAVKAIIRLGQLRAYSPTEKQVEAILSAIAEAFTATKTKLSSAIENQQEAEFALPE